ncbi:MAG: lipoate protein ligase C-terminal domain-containing protein [Calditrichaceae bacterium]
MRSWNEIEKITENKYRTWQWNYGLSPECRIIKEIMSNIGIIKLDMNVKDGIIKSFNIKNDKLEKKNIDRICKYFVNQRLDYVTIKHLQDQVEKNSALRILNKLPWMKILLN